MRMMRVSLMLICLTLLLGVGGVAAYENSNQKLLATFDEEISDKYISFEYIDDYAYTSTTGNNLYTKYNDVAVFDDGSFAAVGQVSTSTSSMYQYYSRQLYSVFGQGERNYTYRGLRYYDELKHVINTANNEMFAVGLDGYYSSGVLARFSSESSKNNVTSTVITNCQKVVEVSPDKFLVSRSGTGLYLYSNVSYLKSISYSYTPISMASFGDNTALVLRNDGYSTYLTNIDVNSSTLWDKTIYGISASEVFVSGGYIYLVGQSNNTTNSQIELTNGGNDLVVVQLDRQGNIIKSKSLGGINNDLYRKSSITNNKLAILYQSTSENGNLIKSNQAVLVFDLDLFDIKTNVDVMAQFNSINGIAVNDDGVVALVGNYGSGSNVRARFVEVCPIMMRGSEDVTIEYGQSFDSENGITFSTLDGEELSHVVSSVTGNIDNLVVGHHYLDYKILIQSPIGVKEYTFTKTFTVEPKVGLIDNAEYQGSVLLDVEGGSFTVNGRDYLTNDVYSSPGESTLVIYGKGGYTKTINFSISLDFSGIQNNYQYNSPVSLNFSGGNATLNGEPYQSGNEISAIGFHQIVVRGEGSYLKTINFLINIVTENISNNQVYHGQVTPILSGGIATLNGIPYQSGETIDTPGLYRLKVVGIGGYSKEYNFTVLPEEINVTNGATYYKSIVVARAKGKLLINDESYISGTELSTPGVYTFKLVGAGEYNLTVIFTIVGGSNLKDQETYVNEVEVEFLGNATLNNKPILSGSVIKEVGHHRLEIVDSFGSKSIDFTIVPDYSVYSDELFLSHTIYIDNATLFLNGKEISSGTTVDKVGIYRLEIIGCGQYNNIIDFTILPQINVEDFKEYTGMRDLDIRGGHLLLNGEEFSGNMRINQVGTYLLEIYGENGYNRNIEFYLLPTITGISNNECYINSVTPIIEHGNIVLDGNPYCSNTSISEIGFHAISILGINGFRLDINFVIVPDNLGIIENTIYSVSATANSSFFEMEVNGVEYVSGTPITTLGKNKLKIRLGEHEKTILFYIIPLIEGVEDSGVYTSIIAPIIDYDVIFLNGNPYSSGTVISSIGYHTMELLNIGSGEYSFTHTLKFIILENVVDVENGKEYEGNVRINVPNASLILNGIPYTNNTVINQIGNHELQIIGVGGYRKQIDFIILPSIVGVEDGGKYDTRVYLYPKVDNAISLTLNNATFYNGNSVYKIGHYELVINGINGYKKTIFWTIDYYLEGIVADGIYKKQVYPIVSHATKLFLNDVIFYSATPVILAGHYKLEIFGVGNYQKHVNFTVEPNVTGVIFGEIYSDSVGVYPQVTNSTAIMLNDEDFSNNSAIYTVGHHQLKIFGVGDFVMIIIFTISPTISGVTDGAVYKGVVTISPKVLNNNSFTLNGETFVNSTSTEAIGHYELVITGLGGYVKKITFTIAPEIIGVTDEGVYIEKVVIDVKGYFDDSDMSNNIMINGKSYSLENEYRKVGNNILTIFGINNYVFTLNFTIKEEGNGLINNYQYLSSFVLNINEARLFVNGKEVPNQTTILTVGHNMIDVIGENGYQSNYTITIIENVEGLIMNETYIYCVTPIINHAILFLNGFPYESNTEIYTVGKNVLRVEGLNGYFNEYEFTVKEKILGLINEKQYDASLRIEWSGVEKLTVNGAEVVSPSVFDTYGKYSVCVIGVGGYIENYTFSIALDVNGIIMDGEYVGGVTMIGNYLNLILDGQECQNRTTINTVGYHTLVATGVGGVQQTISFAISPAISGVKHEGSYDYAVVPIISDYLNLELNGELYQSGTIIYQAGIYCLDVSGLGNYKKSIIFTIKDNLKISSKHIIDEYYYGPTDLMTTNAKFKVDDQWVTQIHLIRVGRYDIIISGVNNYQRQLTIIVLPDLFNETGGSEFTRVWTPEIGGADRCYVDGKNYTNGTPITEVGYHKMTVEGIDGFVYDHFFTINPMISVKRTENGLYTIDISEVHEAFRDGEKIESLNFIDDKIGYHQITLSGVGGYKLAYNYTVEASYELTYKDNYAVFKLFNNSESVTLNGSKYSTKGEIKQTGKHQLIIYGSGEYQHEIIFTVLQEVYRGNAIIPLIKGVKYQLNGVQIKANKNEVYNLAQVGIYTLEATGIDGKIISYHFVVKEEEPIIIKNGQYENSAEIILTQYATYYLNDQKLEYDKYLKHPIVDSIGNHTLIVRGDGDYEMIYHFTIEPRLSVVNNEYFTKPKILKTINATVLLNGKTIDGDTLLDKHGINNLTIVGLNGYEKTITFIYNNPIHNLFWRLVVPVFSVMILGFAWLGIRRRRVGK